MNQKDVEKMSADELRDLRTMIAKQSKKHPYVPPGKRVYGYIPASYAKHMQPCIDYAYETDSISKRKLHSFVTWCVERAIEDITLQINTNKQIYSLKANNSDPEPLID